MAKNHMAEVAAMLGVELGEEFEIEGRTDDTFIITKDNGMIGLTYSSRDYDAQFLRLIKGESRIKKLPWRPKDGEPYWYNTRLLAPNLHGYVEVVRKEIFRSKSGFDLSNLLLGNCYPSEKAAEAGKDKYDDMMKAAQEAVRE